LSIGNSRRSKVGIIGLGLMGIEIARNLISSGYSVYGFDRDKSRLELFKNDGGKILTPPSKMLEEVEVIIFSLPNSQIVKSVVEEELMIGKKIKPGRIILIDTTTADPILTVELAEKLEKLGVYFLDATISGTPPMCRRKEIILMVGGKEEILEKCRNILSCFSKKIFYLGPSGSGTTMKLIVNLVLGLNRLVLAEGLTLAKKAGLDLAEVLNVLKQSAAYSKAMDMKGEKMIKEDFTPPQGKLAMHLKDVKLILYFGERAGVPLFLSSFHAQVLRSLVEKKRGEWDNSAVISFYDDLVN